MPKYKKHVEQAYVRRKSQYTKDCRIERIQQNNSTKQDQAENTEKNKEFVK